MSIKNVLEKLEAREAASIEELKDWLRIPSISTVPERKGDVRLAAEWAAAHLRKSGFDVELHETGEVQSGKGSGHPIVFATCNQQNASSPHILFYGHYDVQPADPLDLWESPPFEPVIKPADPAANTGERIVARGACDDKGQVMMFLAAVRAWHEATGKPAGGARFTIMLEGEEESGSANLDKYLRSNLHRYKDCDACLISDTGMLSRQQPAITYGVRGLVYTEIKLHAANQDLHSGSWGGRAPNPNNEIVKVLSRLWDERGRVTIPGFYDSVRDIGPDERANWSRLPFDAAAALKAIGLPPEADRGEHGFSALEREWGRPTAEINGIFGGYTGAGAKTVIPAWAAAKVSFRLVADQDPADIERRFFDWCKANTPLGCRWELHSHSGGAPATVRTDSTHLRAAMDAVAEATGVRPVLIKTGGSIPIAGMLKATCDLDTIFMGFGLDDDRVHSPNEKFELQCYRWGAKSHALFINRLLSEPRR